MSLPRRRIQRRHGVSRRLLRPLCRRCPCSADVYCVHRLAIQSSSIYSTANATLALCSSSSRLWYTPREAEMQIVSSKWAEHLPLRDFRTSSYSPPRLTWLLSALFPPSSSSVQLVWTSASPHLTLPCAGRKACLSLLSRQTMSAFSISSVLLSAVLTLPAVLAGTGSPAAKHLPVHEQEPVPITGTISRMVYNKNNPALKEQVKHLWSMLKPTAVRGTNTREAGLKKPETEQRPKKLKNLVPGTRS